MHPSGGQRRPGGEPDEGSSAMVIDPDELRAQANTLEASD
jgi:hypothetical protein